MTTQALQGGAIRDDVQPLFSDHALFAGGLKWVLYPHSFQISFSIAYENRSCEGHRLQQAQIEYNSPGRMQDQCSRLEGFINLSAGSHCFILHRILLQLVPTTL